MGLCLWNLLTLFTATFVDAGLMTIQLKKSSDGINEKIYQGNVETAANCRLKIRMFNA